MYKYTIYDTTRFKAVMVMNASRCESNPRMGDLLGSLVWGAKSGQYCVLGVDRYRVSGLYAGIIDCIREEVGRISQAIFQRKSRRRSVSCNFQRSFQNEDGDGIRVSVKSLYKIAKYVELVENLPEQEGVQR
jgi:hypothetical protein